MSDLCREHGAGSDDVRRSRDELDPSGGNRLLRERGRREKHESHGYSAMSRVHAVTSLGAQRVFRLSRLRQVLGSARCCGRSANEFAFEQNWLGRSEQSRPTILVAGGRSKTGPMGQMVEMRFVQKRYERPGRI